MASAPVASPAERARRWLDLPPLLRFGLPAAYVVALAASVAWRGLPSSRSALYIWIVLGLLVVSLSGVGRRWHRVLVDWLPFGAVLFTYDLARGYADSFFAPHVLPQLRADELLFGVVPTVWLQERLWGGPGGIDWIDYAAWLVYLTHFFGTLLVAAALWLFVPRLFRRYASMVVVVAIAGFVTYALYPAVPPWMASESGHLPPTDRIVRYVSTDAPISFFGSVWEHGAHYANDVAAVPSLHAAYSLLITLVLWRLAPVWARVLLAVYPFAMAFALVYTAEHYVSDVLLGWLYALLAFVGVNAVAARIDRR
jgi:membrane-associated phospholipid phosphatase